VNLTENRRRQIIRLLELLIPLWMSGQAPQPSSRFQAVLAYRYVEDLPLREIGKRMNISGERVRQIEMEAVDWLVQTVTKDTPEGMYHRERWNSPTPYGYRRPGWPGLPGETPSRPVRRRK
jgi:hypothetical protein